MGFLDNIVTVFDALINSEEYKDMGSTGERFTYRKLTSLTMFDKKQVLRNVYLKRENGKYTEIDLLAVGNKGIYVFESKNYSGWIFGDEAQAKWTQSLPNGKKTQFGNPIYQNAGHIKALKTALPNYPNMRYFSIITFSERCEIKAMNVTSPDTYVIKRDKLQDTLKKIFNEEQEIITNAEKEEIIKALSAHQRPKEEIKDQHLKDLEESFSKCPFCGGELVERTRKSDGGRFYGCKNYPKCKYTNNELKKINKE